MKRFRTVIQIGIIFSAIALTAPASAQSTDNATMQALLSEVRQLRLTMEKSVSLSPRIQLILQRAQMQDQKVARLSQQLDEVRGRIAVQTSEQARAHERLTKVEEDISTESDAQRRRDLEDVRQALKIEVGKAPDEQLRARENEIANSLQVEQGVLNELSDKLDSLERQLEMLPSDSQTAKQR